MKKSYNDIKEQEHRVIELCKANGRYFDNARNRLDIQHISQITRNTLTQHGFPIFGQFDKDEKRAYVHHEPEHKPEHIKEKEPEHEPKVVKTPTEHAHERVAFDDWLNADEKNRKQLQEACRHRFINKMYAELLTDMEICKMENWDVLEFPRMLRDSISACLPKPRQLSLF